MSAALIAMIFLALAFDFINGFHDAANSIATVVSTRVLSPRTAVVWAAASAQLAALAAGRYAPYPSASERPPLGPIRRTVRRTVLGVRRQRRSQLRPESEESPAALQG